LRDEIRSDADDLRHEAALDFSVRTGGCEPEACGSDSSGQSARQNPASTLGEVEESLRLRLLDALPVTRVRLHRGQRDAVSPA
jgi:hypothetical protein